MQGTLHFFLSLPWFFKRLPWFLKGYLGFLKGYLGWALKPMFQNDKISQYLFIFFIAILCAKMSRVTWKTHWSES
jgi:hypothetical protein